MARTHRGQGRGLAGAAARRDRAVPAPGRRRPAATTSSACSSACTSSDEMLAGRTVLVVDDDVRNIFALSSVLERHGMQRAHRDHRPGGDRASSSASPEVAIVLMDIMMPEMDGYETMRAIRGNPTLRRAADRGAHRQGDEGRPREVPGGRRLRLPRQAGQHRAAARRCGSGCIADRRPDQRPRTPMDKVNILLVDDQPAKLLSYEVDPRAELGENLVKATSPHEALGILLKTEDVAVVLIDVMMPQHRRLRDRRHDPRASALPEARHHLRLGRPGRRDRPSARLRDRRRRLRLGAGGAQGPARQGAGVRRSLPQDPPARGAERRARGSASPRAPPSWRRRPSGCGKARSAARSPCRPATWARGKST